MTRSADALALAAPWSTTVVDLPIPWAMELDVGGRRVLWTNHRATGRAWRGPALNVPEAQLVCAACELERMNATAWRGLLGGLSKVPRPLTWQPKRDKRGHALWEGFDPGSDIDPHTAGRWSLEAVMRRLESKMVSLRVVEMSSVDSRVEAAHG